SADYCERGKCVPASLDVGVAPAHEEPRSRLSNSARESTSGRPTNYGRGHLIRVFRDIGHIFSSLYPSLAVLFLIRFAPSQGLVVCAKHLFFATVRRPSEPRAQGRAMAISSTLPGGKKHHTAGASRAAARRGKTPHPHASSVASRFPCLV